MPLPHPDYLAYTVPCPVNAGKLAWWACVEKHVAVRSEDRSREMAERIFRLALKHFHGEPPSLNFQQAPVGPESVFRATLAHYRAKRLKKQKGPGVIQAPTRPRL